MPEENKPADRKDEGSLTTSIANAMKTHESQMTSGEGSNKEVKEPKDDKKEKKAASIEVEENPDEDLDLDEDEDEETEESEEDDDDLSDEETLKAKQLFKALKDPQQQGAIIEFLANRAGYQKVENKTEAREAKKDVKEQLREALGEEFDFLTDKLGPAIDKIIGDRLEAATKPLAEKQAKAEELRYQEEADAAISSISKVYYNGEEIPQAVSAEMARVMERVKPTAEMTTKQYLEDVYFIAAGRVGNKKGKTNPDLSKRVAANRSNAPDRLKTAVRPGESSTITNNNGGKMSLKDAIQNAVQSVNDSVQ